MKRFTVSMLAATMLLVPAAGFGQLAPAWMIPAAAHREGVLGTFWRTDVNLHNPHQYDLPVVVQLLPSDTENWSAPALALTLGPWETANLWDVLGPDYFAVVGSGALLVYADQDAIDCSDPAACEFLATSRTYTPDPDRPDGEFGQAMPGLATGQGLDWNTYAYVAGVMNDGTFFRANAGVASWTAGWTTVRMDIQDAAGDIVDSVDIQVPPFGHVQRRIRAAVTAGSVVFSLVDGPDDSLVFPYVTVVNQASGDPTFLPTGVPEVGVSIASIARGGARLREVPGVAGERKTVTVVRAGRRAADTADR